MRHIIRKSTWQEGLWFIIDSWTWHAVSSHTTEQEALEAIALAELNAPPAQEETHT